MSGKDILNRLTCIDDLVQGERGRIADVLKLSPGDFYCVVGEYGAGKRKFHAFELTKLRGYAQSIMPHVQNAQAYRVTSKRDEKAIFGYSFKVRPVSFKH